MASTEVVERTPLGAMTEHMRHYHIPYMTLCVDYSSCSCSEDEGDCDFEEV